jgi:Ca2+-binding RTX toxin-like protein
VLGAAAVAVVLIFGGVSSIPSAHALGALCNGKPASDPSFDASGSREPVAIVGTPGDDVIIGGSGVNTILGIGGNDTICGGGHSILLGGPGDDVLILTDNAGGAMVGEEGTDTLYGGPGPNLLIGGFGPDTIYGNGAPDVIIGSDDFEVDKIDGGDGPDRCLFGGGDELASCD